MKVKNLIYNFNNKECRKINYMALPLVLNNVSAMIISLCDQAMVGRTSVAAFGAVGLISTTVNSITGVLGATSIAFNIIGSRCKGANDDEELKKNFVINIVISILIGLIFFLLTSIFGNVFLENLYSLKGEDLSQASEYLRIFSISLGLNMILFTYSSYFKIINKTKNILYGNVVASVSNVFFDYIFIFGHFGFPSMGIRGNAIGSVLGLVLNIIVYILITRKEHLFKLSNSKIAGYFKETIKLSLPIMGQELLESTLLIIAINSILSLIGILEVSVYNLLLTIVSILLMPMYAYSQASLTIIGEDLGGKNLNNMKKTPLRCLVFAVLFYIMLSGIGLVFRNYIPDIITNDAQMITNSIMYLPVAFLINIFFIPSTIYKFSLQGIEDGKWVLLASIGINFIGIILIFLLTQVMHLRLYGVYIGMAVNYIILSISFYYRYRTIMERAFN